MLIPSVPERLCELRVDRHPIPIGLGHRDKCDRVGETREVVRAVDDVVTNTVSSSQLLQNVQSITRFSGLLAPATHTATTLCFVAPFTQL